MAGMTICHPDPGRWWDPRAVIEVAGVDGPDAAGFVIVHGFDGPSVRVEQSWPVVVDTPADAEHRPLIELDVFYNEKP